VAGTRRLLGDQAQVGGSVAVPASITVPTTTEDTMNTQPRLKAEVALDHCRICRSDRQQPGMSIGPMTILPAGDRVHVCGKCLLDMLKVLLKGPASTRSGRA
jgi:hypothetical protein